MVIATGRFAHHRAEIFSDRRRRRACTFETVELRMVFIAFGFAAQHFLRKQSLAPQRGQSLSIEIFRMERPEAQ